MLQSRIRRGELDQEITFIQKDIDESVPAEDYVESWVEIDIDPTVCARRKELPGTEQVVDNQVKFFQKTQWIVDHRTDITVQMRVTINNRVYEILSITEPDMGRGTYLEVVTTLLDSEVYQYTAPTNVVVVFCGEVSLSSNLFPTTGGTGAGGGIKKGNVFRVTAAGTIDGNLIPVNAEIMAKTDVPGQTYANWWIRIV